MEATQLLIGNLFEAFKQLDAYLALGLVTAVSATALERRSAKPDETVDVSVIGGFPALPRETAQLLLVGISFVSGALAAYVSEAAGKILKKLHDNALLDAACTYPSIATAPIGVLILAALLPVAFVGVVMIRKARILGGQGIYLMLFVYAAPFVIIALQASRMDCRAGA